MRPYYQDSAVTIYHGDCREIVPTLGRFDLLLTDPPYGIGYVVKPSIVGKGNRRIMMGGKPAIFGDDEPFDPSFMMDSAKKKITFGANYYSDKLPVSGAWITWDKTGGGRGPDNNFADVELAWSNIGKQPVIFHHLWKGLVRDSEAGEKTLHATQKPIQLMQWCISLAGDDVVTILDPFAGSGTTGRAAKDLGRKATLIEREEKYCEIAAKRMAQEVLAL
jgi:DNA modification methylase